MHTLYNKVCMGLLLYIYTLYILYIEYHFSVHTENWDGLHCIHSISTLHTVTTWQIMWLHYIQLYIQYKQNTVHTHPQTEPNYYLLPLLLAPLPSQALCTICPLPQYRPYCYYPIHTKHMMIDWSYIHTELLQVKTIGLSNQSGRPFSISTIVIPIKISAVDCGVTFAVFKTRYYFFYLRWIEIEKQNRTSRPIGYIVC